MTTRKHDNPILAPLTEVEWTEVLPNPAHVEADILFDYSYDRLDDGHRAALRNHVALCSLCHRRLLQVRREMIRAEEETPALLGPLAEVLEQLPQAPPPAADAIPAERVLPPQPPTV